MKLKAIETRYKGYRFRSRLEARWAVFFDAIKLDWQYEPEGFVLPSGSYYLPDFRINLRGGPLWVEIKPGNETSNLFSEFIDSAPHGWRGTVLNDIPQPDIVASSGHYYEDDRPYVLGPELWDNHYRFCICVHCREVGFEFDGRSARIGCGCKEHGTSDKEYTADHPVLIEAFAKARQARFEHGETPA